MLTRFNAALAKFCMVAAVTGLLVIVVCVLYQVFGRYILNDTPTWAEALALVLVLWVTMLGAAVGVRDAGHIGMESLLVWVTPEKRRKLEILIHVLSAMFGAMMAWQGTI
jgi:TRAP-type C4-dicarboxylate transport system permease small subunit